MLRPTTNCRNFRLHQAVQDQVRAGHRRESMTHFFALSPDVYACQFEAAIILLDVNADRYFRLTSEQTDLLHEISAVSAPAQLSEGARRFANRLLDRAVIAPAAHDQSTMTLSPITEAQESILDLYSEEPFHTAFGHLVPLAYAIISCWTLERTGSFARVVRAVRKWKKNALRRPHPPSVQVHALVADFHALSPFLLTTDDACRFRSLVLIKFLALFNIPTDWVFGVRLSPFGAHCWVEQDGLILNDHADNTTEYRRIMTV